MNQATNFGGLNLEKNNQLWRYVASMEPEVVARLSQPASEEVLQVMEQHVGALLGHLPASYFDVSVTTSREGLGQLLAAAMMNGYFLRAVEQRMGFEQALQARDGDREPS
jgi:hypothetical protein